MLFIGLIKRGLIIFKLSAMQGYCQFVNCLFQTKLFSTLKFCREMLICGLFQRVKREGENQIYSFFKKKTRYLDRFFLHRAEKYSYSNIHYNKLIAHIYPKIFSSFFFDFKMADQGNFLNAHAYYLVHPRSILIDWTYFKENFQMFQCSFKSHFHITNGIEF